MVWHALSDRALLAHAPDEATAWRWAEAIRARAWPWVEDVVQAYASVAVHHVAGPREAFRNALAEACRDSASAVHEPRLRVVPVCYELGLDFERIERHTGLSREAIVAAHAGTEYVVYAIGFCPGFPYLGYLPESLAGVPRLERPRRAVPPGSVGLTGRQTGIYPEARPGGWNLVGRTPLTLVDVADAYFPLRAGDRVRFDRIDEATFAQLAGTRLDG